MDSVERMKVTTTPHKRGVSSSDTLKRPTPHLVPLPSCLGTRFARRLHHAESTHRQLFPTFALALYLSRFTTKGKLGSVVIGSKIWCERLVYQYEEQERMAPVRTKCTQSRNGSATSKLSVFFQAKCKVSRSGKLGDDVFVHESSK